MCKQTIARISSLAMLVCLLGSCNIPTRSIRPQKLPDDPVNGPYYQSKDYTINSERANATSDSVTVQYLGCGGLYVRKNEISFLVDPFFSNVKMLPGLKLRLRRLMWLAVLAKRDIKIKPHIKSIELGYSLVEKQPDYIPPKAILVTHGHYDHLLDVPYIYKNKTAHQPVVYANLTSVNLLKNMIPGHLLRNLEPGMQNQHNTGTWNVIGDASAGEYIRFMALEADHAPHAKSLKLFDGDGMYAFADYEEYMNGTPINRWLEGRTLGLLVDFMKRDGTISYRMFIQTSACPPTRGLLSQALKKEKAVDMAVICVASFELADAYPETLLQHLEAEQIMLVHWEDFLFKSYKRLLQKPKTIGFSDVRSFMNNMRETRSRHKLKYRYHLPAPGVKATVVY